MEPVEIELPPLPSSRSPAVPKVAEFFRLVYGLRLQFDMPEEVPFASGWVAEGLGYPKLTCWRAIQALVDAGALVRPPERSLPGRGGYRGTDLFLPGEVDRGSRDDLMQAFAAEFDAGDWTCGRCHPPAVGLEADWRDRRAGR